ncbi:MAG: hypothetical protein LBM75_10505 [Myxococcales bacterium]|jgi:tetratricopeptide (TPR) repeat protein|nr:hypothetical protein [Myxococcales bacterium]
MTDSDKRTPTPRPQDSGAPKNDQQRTERRHFERRRGQRSRRGEQASASASSSTPPPTMAGVETFILEALSALERPLTRGEFAEVGQGFQRIAARLEPLRLSSIDVLDFDARTHLLTALLRAGRLPSPADDPDKLAARRDMLSAVGDTWLAVGDEARADKVYEAAGRPDRAIARLEREGQWREAAELAARAGNLKQAAQIFEAHGDKERAFALFQQAGEQRSALKLALELGRREEIRALAKSIDFKEVRALLFQHGLADLYLELVAEMGDWREVARLYEQAGQHGDAARAYERAGNVTKALDAFNRAGQQGEVQRLARQEAAAREQRGDLAGAGNVLCRFGLLDEAVALTRASRPELAFKWLERAGQLDRARAFAAEMVGRLDAQGDRLLCAIWLERSGDKARAAERWRALGKPEEALRLYTALCDWRSAAALTLEMGELHRAADFHARAGIALPDEVAQALLEAASTLTDPAAVSSRSAEASNNPAVGEQAARSTEQQATESSQTAREAEPSKNESSAASDEPSVAEAVDPTAPSNNEAPETAPAPEQTSTPDSEPGLPE